MIKLYLMQMCCVLSLDHTLLLLRQHLCNVYAGHKFPLQMYECMTLYMCSYNNIMRWNSAFEKGTRGICV